MHCHQYYLYSTVFYYFKAYCISLRNRGDNVSDEKQKEVKLVNISFLGALKFWLAFLVVQIIAMVIIFFIGTIVFVVFIQPLLQEIIESIPQLPTGLMTTFP